MTRSAHPLGNVTQVIRHLGDATDVRLGAACGAGTLPTCVWAQDQLKLQWREIQPVRVGVNQSRKILRWLRLRYVQAQPDEPTVAYSDRTMLEGGLPYPAYGISWGPCRYTIPPSEYRRHILLYIVHTPSYMSRILQVFWFQWSSIVSRTRGYEAVHSG